MGRPHRRLVRRSVVMADGFPAVPSLWTCPYVTVSLARIDPAGLMARRRT